MIVFAEINYVKKKGFVPASEMRGVNLTQLPMILGQMMCLFEGNGMILNMYSEVKKPTQFFP